MSEPASGASNGTGRAVAGAAGLLAGSVLIARLLGWLRDALFASQVGVGPGADAYFAAFMIPDILGYLLAAGAAATAVTPPYLKRLKEQGPEAAARFASVIVGSVGLLSTLFTCLLWFAAEPLIRIQFPVIRALYSIGQHFDRSHRYQAVIARGENKTGAFHL